MKRVGSVLCILILVSAGSALATGSSAWAAGPNWKVRESIGKKEGFLGGGTTLAMEQFTTGQPVTLQFFEKIKETRTLIKEIYCSANAEYKSETITGGSPGTLNLESLSFTKCSDLTHSTCVVSNISWTKPSGELVYYNSGAGAALLMNKTKGTESFVTTFEETGASCTTAGLYKIKGTLLWFTASHLVYGPQLLVQSCGFEMCLYNENGTGTVREAKLTSGGAEVDVITEDRTVLSPNKENYEELAIE
jgi:hypothetical protein